MDGTSGVSGCTGTFAQVIDDPLHHIGMFAWMNGGMRVREMWMRVDGHSPAGIVLRPGMGSENEKNASGARRETMSATVAKPE